MNPVNQHRCWRTSYKPRQKNLDKKKPFQTWKLHIFWAFLLLRLLAWWSKLNGFRRGLAWADNIAGRRHTSFREKRGDALSSFPTLLCKLRIYYMNKNGKGRSFKFNNKNCRLLGETIKIRTSGTCCYSIFWDNGESNIINGLYAFLSKE